MQNSLHIVLYEPEIPQNTGNISRTCAAVGAHLHLIEPLGFELTDAKCKRAGLDYWQYLSVSRYPNWAAFEQQHRKKGSFYFFTTKGRKVYTEPDYQGDVYIIFGKETGGLPEELLLAHPDECVRLPMLDGIRSLNLSNSVAVAAYEVLRHWNFTDLKLAEELTRFRWM